MIPVILSGGSGTRLWPVSRAAYPKQFCEFYDGSFLLNTVRRLRGLGQPYILTVRDMQSLTGRLAATEEINKDHILLEPMGKNTAPAIALLCHVLATRGLDDQIAGVFPSDHLIENEEVFARAVKLGADVAAKGKIVTLGITPHNPATGYGYIELAGTAEASAGNLQAFAVKGFKEKPDVNTAKDYVKSGRYVWNAGMFLFRVRDMIAHFQKLQPTMWQKISSIKPDLSNLSLNYAMVDNISFDYAIMEKVKDQACVPCDIGWSDVGSLDELARLDEGAAQLKSQSKATVFSEGATNNYVFGVANKVVGLVGVEDLIVVETPDAVLVAKKGSSQKVKELVAQIKEAGLPEATEHQFEERPWGGYAVLAEDPDFKVKRIRVDRGAQISYQSHAQRTEHWVVIRGSGEVTLDDKVNPVKPGSYIKIPVGSKHRIKNSGSEVLIFVEIQTGTYFGEDDIVRYQDDYNRVVT